MWEDFKNIIKAVIFYSIVGGIGLYFLVFSTRNSFDELVYQEVYDQKYNLKNSVIQVGYKKWLSDKIEKEFKK